MTWTSASGLRALDTRELLEMQELASEHAVPLKMTAATQEGTAVVTYDYPGGIKNPGSEFWCKASQFPNLGNSWKYF